MKTRFSRRFAFVSFSFIFLSLFTVFYKSDSAASKSGSPTLVPNLTIAKTAALDASAGGDLNGNGVVNPGDKLNYQITVSNSGTDATNVIVQDVLNSNLTLVPGSVNTSPIAVDDSYDAIGNVTMVVPDGAGDLTSNDIDGDANSISAVAGTFTTTQNGSITIAANGSFSYEPPRGFNGTDTYVYSINDNSGASNATATGTITITVSTPLWFINPAAASDGNGTFTSPYKNLSTFSTQNNGAGSNPADGDFIFLYSGAHSGGLTLSANQKVIGQGATVSILFLTGAATPSGTNQLPATSGARPVIANNSGAGITLNSGNAIRGLNAGGSTFAIDDNGASVGNLAVSEVAVNSTGGGLRVDNGSGTLVVALDSLTAAGGVNAINLAGTSGGAVSITGAVTASNTTGDSISLTNNSATFTVGGLTQVNTTATGFIGIHMVGGTAAITFGNVEINGRRGKAIRISSGSRNITTGAVDIDNTNSETATALEILLPSAGTISFGDTDINCNNTGSAAVEVQNSAASVSFGAGSSIVGSNGADFLINQGSGSVTYNGSITNAGGSMITVTSHTGGTIDFQGDLTSSVATTPITANGNTGGTVTFSGGTKTLNSGTATAVNLTSNTGATFNFTNGGLAINTTTATGFNATGGGTVSVTTGGNANSITSTTGSALNVQNTSIGASGMTFRSIASSGGTASGIILVSTGSNALTVTGDGGTTKGGNGSGGTITNKTGGTDGDGTTASAVYINNGAATLRNMTFTRLDNFGLYGLSVNNVTLQYATVGAISGSACADADGDIGNNTNSQDAAIVFGKSNPGGANGFSNGAVVLLDNLLVRCSIEHQVEMYAQSNSFTATVSNSDIKDNSTAGGSDGVQVELQGTSNGIVNVNSNSFDDNKSQMVQGAANDNSVLDMTVNGNTGIRSTQGNEGIVLSNGSNGRLTTHITNNTTSGFGGSHIFVGQTPGNANALAGNAIGLTAVIKGNNVTMPTSGTNHAINVLLSSTVGQISRANILIESNTIAQNSTSGIARPFLVDTPDSNTSPTFTATVINNNVTAVDAGTGTSANVTARRGAGCFDIRNNTIAGPFGITARQQSVAGETAATAQLEQGVSASNVPATVMDDNHPAGTVTNAIGTISVVNNNTCLTAPTVPLPDDENAFNANKISNDLSFLNKRYQPLSEMVATIETFGKYSEKARMISTPEIAQTETTFGNESNIELLAVGKAVLPADTGNVSVPENKAPFYSRISAFAAELGGKLGETISPTVTAQESSKKQTLKLDKNKSAANAPEAGETVCVDGNANPNDCTGGFTLPANKSVTVVFKATVNAGSTATTIPNTANVTAAGGINLDSSAVNTNVVQPPTLSKEFGASSISFGSTTTLTFTIGNPNPATNLTNISFVDNLPPGLVVANPNGLVNNCGGGTISAAPDSTSVGVSALARNAATTCTIKVNVRATSVGEKQNVTGATSSTQSSTGGTAAATLTVTNPVVSGTVSYGIVPMNQPQQFVPGVQVAATGASSVADATEASGNYLLAELSPNGQYTVTASKTGDVNGITSFDAALVLRCAAAGNACDLTPNQQTAADTDNSSTITSFDAAQILRFVAANGSNADTGNTGNWKFNPPTYSYNPLTASFAEQNFAAVLVGEVDGNWTPPTP